MSIQTPQAIHSRSCRSWYDYLIPPCALALITCIVYYPSLHYAFQFDDLANITRHFNIRYNTLENLFFANSRWISYWINALHYSWATFEPFSYRLGNVTLHTINGILIFFILLHALTNLRKHSFFKQHAYALACLTSLLFLVHPVQTQTVSYVIQGQLEGLATFFIVSMLICLQRFACSTSRMSGYVLLITLYLLAFLSCGSKEIAIIAPALLMLFDWFFIAQGQWQNFKTRLPIFGSLSLLIVGCYLYLLKPAFFTEILGLKKVVANNMGNVITQNNTIAITPWLFCISQFKVMLHYLWMFMWPFGISVEYDWVLVDGFFSIDCLLPLIALLALCLIIVRLLVKNTTDIRAFCLSWFFLCIGPRATIIPSAELVADYKTYMASWALLLILAALLVHLYSYSVRSSAFLSRFNHRHVAVYAYCACALAVGLCAMQRNTVWRSGLDFWGDIIHHAPSKARAYNNYGIELLQTHKKFQESVAYFLTAIKLDAHYPDPCHNLAVAYAALGQTALAIDALKKGLAINPYYPEGYNNLASFFLQVKDYAQAEKALLAAVKLRPYYGRALYNLGKLHLDTNNKEKALYYFKKSCMEADFDNEAGFFAYAQTSFALHKFDDAIEGYTKALTYNPNNYEALFNLGNAYFLSHEPEQALVRYKQLVAKDPTQLRAIFNIGETYFMMDKPQEALPYFLQVQSHHKQFPQVVVRLADCYAQLGNTQKAASILHDFIDTTPHQHLKVAARDLLHELQACRAVHSTS